MKSRIVLLQLAVVLLASTTTVTTQQHLESLRERPGDHSLSLKVGDLERRYIVHLPAGYDGKKAVAVVMMFHGAGGTARGAMRQTGWCGKADQAGFIAVFPEAMSRDPSRPARFRGNPQVWNDGSGRGRPARRNIDDVAFASALIDDLQSRFTIDKRRIFATGFSNGASMVFQLGEKLSARIASIAPVSGPLWLNNPKLNRPVPLVYLVGSEDPFYSLDVRPALAKRGINRRPPVGESLLKWAGLLGYPLEATVIFNENGVKGSAYRPCKEKAEVVFYTIEGMGHTWAGGMSRLPEWMVGKTTSKLKANDIIWEFFQRHPME